MPESSDPAPPDAVTAIRRFNRFYTRQIGALDRGHLRSEFSLAEARVLHELAHWADARLGQPTATDLARDLGLDPGQLSRTLLRFEKRGLIERSASDDDGRIQLLGLTRAGRTAVSRLDSRADAEIRRLIAPLAAAERRKLLQAQQVIERLLGEDEEDGDARPPRRDGDSAAGFVLRSPRVGDYGWVVERHGALYAKEYGWDARFEALVARVVADFVEHLDPARERGWIAQRDGERAGSVFLVKHPERPGVAKLRLLLVEPSARGFGIGRRLVDECTRFARNCGYHTITLWTNSVLVSARRIYEAAGYRLVSEEKHRMFGPEAVGQTWELMIDAR